MKAYRIYLLRHGMTASNKEGRYVGRLDVPLCEEGRQALTEMAENNKYPQADLFYCSPRTRCKQTLEIIYPGVSPIIADGLAETDFGDFEGKTFEELKNDETYQKWCVGEAGFAPPNGESPEVFEKRCSDAFEEIVNSLLRSGKRSAVIMAHGGTIMLILSKYAFPRKAFYEWRVGNGCGFEVVITPQLWQNCTICEVTESIPASLAEERNMTELDLVLEELENKIKENGSDK